ncbi:Mitochondrial thiamine pyrophosphate carrier [Dirofilaria immitis]
MIGYGTYELTSFEYSEAGLITGIVTRFLIQPLDVLKIRFQVQREPTFGKVKGRYHGIVQACLQIYKDEGLVAFWKGHIPAQGLSAIYGVVQFTTFEFLTGQALRYPHAIENRQVTDVVCGALAGCAGMTCAMPFDVIRTRLIIQNHHKIYDGTLHAIISIWKSEGYRGFFRGVTPSLIQIAPFIGLQFSLYNALSSTWAKLPNYLESFGPLCCGALAGVISKTAIYPLDVVRHRLQANGFGRFKQSPWHSMYSTIVIILKNEKIAGLFKGLWPSQLKAASSSGLSFMLYEICLEVMHDRKSR